MTTTATTYPKHFRIHGSQPGRILAKLDIPEVLGLDGEWRKIEDPSWWFPGPIEVSADDAVALKAAWLPEPREKPPEPAKPVKMRESFRVTKRNEDGLADAWEKIVEPIE